MSATNEELLRALEVIRREIPRQYIGWELSESPEWVIGSILTIATNPDLPKSITEQALGALEGFVSKNRRLDLEMLNPVRKMVMQRHHDEDERLERENMVYLMRHELSNCWKIGRSVNPSSREKTLQHQDPRIALEWSVNAPQEFENWLHDIFCEKRIRGEWFELSADDVEWIKTLALAKFETFIK